MTQGAFRCAKIAPGRPFFVHNNSQRDRKANGGQPWQEQNSPSRNGSEKSPGNRNKKTRRPAARKPDSQRTKRTRLSKTKLPRQATGAPISRLLWRIPAKGKRYPDKPFPFAFFLRQRPFPPACGPSPRRPISDICSLFPLPPPIFLDKEGKSGYPITY
jgi:hypothetical protein